MGKVGKRNTVIGASVPIPVGNYLKTRGESIDQTQSWAVARVVDFWLRCGAPPLSDVERKHGDIPPVPEEIWATLEGPRLLYAAEEPAPYGATPSDPAATGTKKPRKMDPKKAARNLADHVHRARREGGRDPNQD